jgi:ATP-dependent DNA helicase RecG
MAGEWYNGDVNLDDKLSNIKGVGPKTAEKLAGAGFLTVGDLIDFLPRTYEDFSTVVRIADLRPGKTTVRARAEKVATRRPRWRMTITEATLRDSSGAVRAVWFNQFYRQAQLESDQEFYVSGVFEFARGRYQLTNPSVEAVKDLPVQTGRILPIYPARGGLKVSLTRAVLDKLRPIITMLPETLPDEVVASEKLLSRADAMLGLHFPETAEHAEAARARLAFEELFELLLASRLNKRENSKLRGFKIPFDQPKIKDFVAKLPFELTNAQRRAIWDILCDFEKPNPMNRMLQGDVGSGKTVVAGAAVYQASLAGYQSVIMAPTEILATQHAETLSRLLEPFGVKVALLTGSVKGKARQELYKVLASGEVDVAVGTHALFQPDVKFHKLGFVVIDEQHRFGVKQRQALLAKSKKMPHLLSMTATPIPRSLQLTVFGDLDISILNELPKGRKQILTKIYSPQERAKVYKLIRDQLQQGRQAYIITPLIEEKENESATRTVLVADGAERRAAEEEFKKIKKIFTGSLRSARDDGGKDGRDDGGGYRVGLLHGKLSAGEKEQVMRQFADHELDILVATTVVEVGVDVPNATVMMIENADQFGLAQLHQLRGRVGRSEHQSYCYLIMTENKPPTRRLREVEKSNDGFYLSEVDLKLRGPGEIYGTLQHGDLNLQIANLADTKLIARAAKTAEKFIADGGDLSKYPTLRENVLKYQKLTTLN